MQERIDKMVIKLISFDVNQTEFPNERIKEIWFLGKNIVPIEISLADITDTEMREGCTQIYQFTREIFSDMYNKPEQYRSLHFDLLFSRFIKFGALIDESGFNWVIPSDAFKKIKHFGDFETVLMKFGFRLSKAGSHTMLSNEKYPLFLKYWYPLFKTCQKRGMSIMSCDFRLFTKKFKLTIDDFLCTQTDKDKATFKEFNEYAISKGAKLETNFQYRKFRYIYKNECILIFENIEMNPCIVVPYNNQYSKKRDSWISFDLFIAKALKQPDKDELIKYIQNEICICSACSGRKVGPKKSDECCGHWLDIHGVRRMAATCHPEISKCHNLKESHEYTDYDVQMLKRMIDIRISQIDDYDS